MKDLSGSFSSTDDLLEDNPPVDALSQETLPKELSSDETLLDNPFEVEEVPARSRQPDDLSSIEDGLAIDAIPQDLSPENSSTVGDRSTKEAPFEDKSFKGTSSQQADPESETETGSEPDMGHNIKKSLQSMLQWCEEVSNRPDDIVTNFKSQLPFLIVLAVLVLFLWGLKLLYG